MGNGGIKGEIKIMILGLSSSGKSHFVYTLKYGETNGIRTTNGYNTEMWIHKGYRLNFIDVGAKTPTAFKEHLMDDIGCLLYFVDATFSPNQDGLENLHVARNDLLALMMSDNLAGVPVGIIHNVRNYQRSSFMGGCNPLNSTQRPFDDLLVGFGISKLRTWATVFVTDLSYKDDEAIETLLLFIIKHAKVVK
jgi:hypothetical protein